MNPLQACQSKKWYPSRRVAKQEAARIHGRKGWPKMQAYRCPVEGCQGWHLTSWRGENRADLRARYRGGRW